MDQRWDMPQITDYREALKQPLYESAMGAMGSANPYDTRRDAMLRGPTNRINEEYEEAARQLEHRFANNLGSPAYRAAQRELSEERANKQLDLEAQFAGTAAGVDEQIRIGRQGALGSALGQEQGMYMGEMDMQDRLQRNATDDWLRLLSQNQGARLDAAKYDDEALRYMLGGQGSQVQPAVGSALAAQQGAVNQGYAGQGQYWGKAGDHLGLLANWAKDKYWPEEEVDTSATVPAQEYPRWHP